MPGSSRARRTTAALLGLTLGLALATGAGAASGAPRKPGLTASPLSPAQVFQGVKSQTGRLAHSDPALLGRSDATPVNVVVKLDYDSVAVYDGGIPGLAPTNPAVTGRKLNENAGAVSAYERHVAGEEARIVSAIARAVPAADVGDAYRNVYGGVSMTLPANKVKDLLAVDRVVAVQQDRLEQPQTDVTPGFLGATAVWPSLGGFNRAGQGVIVGVLDTGITPQHPSFQDPGIARPAGTAGVRCQFGDGSDPELGPPAACNDKLIGAYAFLDTYMTVLDVLPGEFCNEATGRCSARDSDGHGTHTAATAAGSPVGSAPLFGIERGPISGIAPGASVIAYRVCLAAGCFQSDSVAAVNQAIEDGVDVINFSISGGEQPFTDPVELAFLEFYDAGGLANASAGNSGPGAGTAAHGGPWTNTVGASTSPRHFLTTLRMRSTNGNGFTAVGSSITPAIPDDTPVVLAKTLLAGNDGCTATFPAGSATGKIVVCQGASGRNAKALKVQQAGGVGMILYSVDRRNLFTDNFWVPTVMLNGPSPGNDAAAFVAENPGVTARWQTGQPTPVRADEMTAFSSRGPLGDFIKPDVTAPGMEIFAGTTPTPWPGNPVAGPPGQLFQSISGTSMSSPHAAGVSALIKAAHPDWTPGQIKSAMMTSSVQDVVKNDGVTPSDPFDRGAGSIRVDRAVAAPVTFDVSAESYVLSATDPLNRVNLNLASIDATSMAGELTTTRRMKNVSGRELKLDAETIAPPGSRIVVSPSTVDLRPNESRTVTISILGKDLARNAQYFGQVTFKARGRSLPDTVLPVAFFTKQGAVSLSHTCAATSIANGSSTHCELKATNNSPAPANTTITVTGAQKGKLEVRNVVPPATATKDGLTWTGMLSAAKAPTITGLVTPGDSPAGYVPLSAFGIAPIAGIGDETLANFNTPAFKYGTEEYTRIAVTSNGYAVVGGGSSQDLNYAPPATWPSPERPNNVLAPYWSDLNPAAGGAVRVGILTDGVTDWLIADWENVPTYSSATQTRSFQTWIQLGSEGIWFTYGTTGPGDPSSGLAVGAENRDGTSGIRLPAATIPADGSDIAVTTAPPVPGGSVLLGYDAFGAKPGLYRLVARMTSDITTGTAAEPVNLEVTKKQ